MDSHRLKLEQWNCNSKNTFISYSIGLVLQCLKKDPSGSVTSNRLNHWPRFSFFFWCFHSLNFMLPCFNMSVGTSWEVVNSSVVSHLLVFFIIIPFLFYLLLINWCYGGYPLANCSLESRPMAWFFLAHVTVPNLSTVMFYYQTEFLKLDASFLGTARVLGWLGLMIGTLTYNRYLKKMRLRYILM